MNGMERHAAGTEPIGNFTDVLFPVRIIKMLARGEDFNGLCAPADEAIEHVNRYTSGHSDAIVTQSTDVARAFTSGVDTACVYVNASTRFTDGGEFGMGAEIGNSTQKLHARGPIGLRELCTFKYLIEGDGHVRS